MKAETDERGTAVQTGAAVSGDTPVSEGATLGEESGREHWLYPLLALDVLVLLVLSVLPILLMGRYTAQAADDFIYGVPVHYTIQAGKGLLAVLRAVWENIRYTYVDWQGTYSSVILFSLEPGAFDPEAYGVTAWVMTAVVIGSALVAVGALRAGRWGRLLLGGLIGFYCVQYLPSPAEGYYWWNGAAHYLAFWFFMLLALTWQIRLTRREGGWGLLWRTLVGCLLAFWVGGGNFCTALVFPLLSACLLLCALARRRPLPVIGANLLVALVGTAGLLISVAAPGNNVRQRGFAIMDPVKAISMSFQMSVEDLGELLTPQLGAALAVCLPLFLLITRRSGYRFRRPGIVIPACFCALSALYTPPLYAMGPEEIMPRTENLFWIAGVFFLFGSAFYLAGWIRCRMGTERQGTAPLAALAGLGGLLFLGVTLAGFWQTNGYGAYKAITDPGLEEYELFRMERTAVYEARMEKPMGEAAWEGYPEMEQPPAYFSLVQAVTWAPHLVVDGEPVRLTLYRGRGGEKTYVELGEAKDRFRAHRALEEVEFTTSFQIGDKCYVPLRDVCRALGHAVSYSPLQDTVYIRRGEARTGRWKRAEKAPGTRGERVGRQLRAPVLLAPSWGPEPTLQWKQAQKTPGARPEKRTPGMEIPVLVNPSWRFDWDKIGSALSR